VVSGTLRGDGSTFSRSGQFVDDDLVRLAFGRERDAEISPQLIGGRRGADRAVSDDVEVLRGVLGSAIQQGGAI
jgi:hypothetical protein